MVPGLKYGLLATLGTAAWILASYALGLHTRHFGISHYTDLGTELILLLALGCLLHGQVRLAAPHWLPVWRGLLHGLYASLVAAMGLYIVLSLYLMFVNHEFFDLKLEHQVAHLRAIGRPEEEVRNVARSFRAATGPVQLPLTILTLYLLIGLVASPLLTLWFNWRRK